MPPPRKQSLLGVVAAPYAYRKKSSACEQVHTDGFFLYAYGFVFALYYHTLFCYNSLEY